MASLKPDSEGKNLRTRWLEAFDETKRYRQRLERTDIANNEKSKCYSLHRDEIEALLNQHGHKMDGIRIYIGEKDFGNNEFVINLYVVPTHKMETRTGKSAVKVEYDDYNIPQRKNLEKRSEQDSPLPKAIAPHDAFVAQNIQDQVPDLIMLRPCPQECSNNNDLNS